MEVYPGRGNAKQEAARETAGMISSRAHHAFRADNSLYDQRHLSQSNNCSSSNESLRLCHALGTGGVGSEEPTESSTEDRDTPMSTGTLPQKGGAFSQKLIFLTRATAKVLRKKALNIVLPFLGGGA